MNAQMTLDHLIRVDPTTMRWILSGLDHTLPTNTVYSPLDLGHPGVGNRRENKNGSVECRRICEIKSSEYMS
jgi:hypothetical protein